MKTIKPSIPKILTVFLIVFSVLILELMASKYALSHFNYIPKIVLFWVSILLLNYFILESHIKSWFKKGTLIINLTYVIIAILLLGLAIVSSRYGLISTEYYYISIFIICYCILRVFEKEVD